MGWESLKNMEKRAPKQALNLTIQGRKGDPGWVEGESS